MTKKTNFFELFAGEFVEIVIDKDIETTESKNDTITQMKMPITVQGYLTEECDDYLYLGLVPQTISQCVKKEYIIHVQVSEEKTVMDELIELGEVPEGDKFN